MPARRWPPWPGRAGEQPLRPRFALSARPFPQGLVGPPFPTNPTWSASDPARRRGPIESRFPGVGGSEGRAAMECEQRSQ